MNVESLEKYIKITAEDGMVITEWKEEDNITGFTYCRQMFAPLNTDIKKLREITEDEKNRIEDEKNRIEDELVREFRNFAQD